MNTTASVDAILAEVHRRDWGLVLAATVHTVRDLDLAEECVQEAYAAALRQWPTDGVPDNPAAWLTTTAKRRGVDAVRREVIWRSKLSLLVPDGPDARSVDVVVDDQTAVPDERLRLMFLCCHPSLAPDAQTALTLRLVCGLSTHDIARGFLVSEPTMAARLTRAKKKIIGSRIPYRMPVEAELADRLAGVLGAVHLVFTAGHTAASGPDLTRPDLADQAVRLARLLGDLLPDEPEVQGLLALLLVHHARWSTRTATDGQLLRFADQDRAQWNRTELAEARALVLAALPHRGAGPYVLQAAIASLYTEPASYADTDWPQILALYDALLAVQPSPVVALNRAVPLAQVAGPHVALQTVTALENGGQLTGYHYLPAVKADLLTQLGRPSDASQAWRTALDWCDNTAEQDFIRTRIIDPTVSPFPRQP